MSHMWRDFVAGFLRLPKGHCPVVLAVVYYASSYSCVLLLVAGFLSLLKGHCPVVLAALSS
jgi:hypothetical protein